VKRAEDWRWSSLWRRVHGDREARQLLHRWPLPEPKHWLKHVNRAPTEAELEAVRRSIHRGCPFGADHWQKRTGSRLGLAWTLRSRGRPRKQLKG
jgi:putative transposase